jgi:RHS repeat-associated protein
MADTPAGGSTQQFTWDVSSSVPDLLADGTNSYLYGPNGTPVEQIVTSTSAATYLVSDPTGVRYQFNASGTVAGTKSYNPYGKCSSCSGSTPFGFEDGYTDPNGLVYLVNRYYDPTTAQFLSVDPLVAETGQPFAYAGDDPVNGSDPSGLITCGGFWGWVPGCGTTTDVQNGVSGATNSASSAVTNELQTIDCNAVGGGNSIFNGILGCAGDSNGPACSLPGSALAGALKPGSNEAETRAALAEQGVEIPSDYWAEPANNGKGWVFRPPGSTDDSNLIETQDAGASRKSPNGSYRIYNSEGIPIDGGGQELGAAGVGQPETHFQFPPDPEP